MKNVNFKFISVSYASQILSHVTEVINASQGHIICSTFCISCKYMLMQWLLTSADCAVSRTTGSSRS